MAKTGIALADRTEKPETNGGLAPVDVAGLVRATVAVGALSTFFTVVLTAVERVEKLLNIPVRSILAIALGAVAWRLWREFRAWRRQMRSEWALQGIRLQKLDLSGNPVKGDSLLELSGLTSLKELDLSGTLVNGSGLNKLEALICLRRLDLSGSRVDNTSLLHLKGLTGLPVLVLSSTDNLEGI